MDSANTNGPHIMYTSNPSITCTALPAHWRCNKALPAPFEVFVNCQIKDGVEVTLRAENDENFSAELKNFTAPLKAGVAAFPDLRFLGRSGRGKSLDIVITVDSVPRIVAYAKEAIKVTVDGPREPRRRRTIQHEKQYIGRGSISNSLTPFSDSTNSLLEPLVEDNVSSDGLDSSCDDLLGRISHGSSASVYPKDEGKSRPGVIRVRSRTVPASLRRCQSAPYIPDIKAKRLSVTSQGGTSDCCKTIDELRAVGESVSAFQSSPKNSHSNILIHNNNSSSNSNNNCNSNGTTTNNISLLRNIEEMRRLRSESLGSVHDFIDNTVSRGRLLSSDGPLIPIAQSPDYTLSKRGSLSSSPTLPQKYHVNRDFQFVSFNCSGHNEGDSCIAQFKFSNPENYTLHVMFGAAVPAFEKMSLDMDGVITVYFKVPKYVESGSVKNIEVSAFYRINTRVVFAVGSHSFSYETSEVEGGEIPEVKLNVLMLKLHLKNQQYQIQMHDVDLARHGPSNILEQIRPLEDKLFHRCVAVLTCLGQLGDLPAVDAGYSGDMESSSVGITVLHLAAEFGWCKFISQLIQSGANVNQCDLLGNSALDWAFMSDQHEAVQVLTSYGGSFYTFSVQDMGETLSKMDIMNDSGTASLLDAFDSLPGAELLSLQ